ncbi:NADAR domain-containing protein [Escherichia coli]
MKNTAKRSVRISSLWSAARMGRDRSKPLRKNWESVKEQVMRKALRAKFEQHPELRALLLATAPAKLG